MREDGVRNLIHGTSNVLNGGIRVNSNVFQGGLKGSETLTFQKCADGGGSIGGTIDKTSRRIVFAVPSKSAGILDILSD
jgi:hypothetical protein